MTLLVIHKHTINPKNNKYLDETSFFNFVILLSQKLGRMVSKRGEDYEKNHFSIDIFDGNSNGILQ